MTIIVNVLGVGEAVSVAIIFPESVILPMMFPAVAIKPGGSVEIDNVAPLFGMTVKLKDVPKGAVMVGFVVNKNDVVEILCKVGGSVHDDIKERSKNACASIVVTLSGIVRTPVKLQFAKQALGIVLIPVPIFREVKPVQILNAFGPIVVTLSGIVREPVKPIQILNAYCPIKVTVLGIIRGPVN